MPNTKPGWRQATFLALLLIGSLPSCTTLLLWGGRVSGSDARIFAARTAELSPTPDGRCRLAVQLDAPLPDGCAPALPRGTHGQWLVADLDRNHEAFAEIVRLAETTGMKPEYQVSLYHDDELLVDAMLRLQPEHLPLVRVTVGLRVEFDSRLATQVKGKRATILDTRPDGGQTIATPSLRWWEPRPNEPRHSLPEKVFFTPFTVLLDAVAIPVVPLGLLFWNTYHRLGGRA